MHTPSLFDIAHQQALEKSPLLLRIISEARLRMFHACASRNKNRVENCYDFYCFTAEWAFNVSSHAHKRSPSCCQLLQTSQSVERAEALFSVFGVIDMLIWDLMIPFRPNDGVLLAKQFSVSWKPEKRTAKQKINRKRARLRQANWKESS